METIGERIAYIREMQDIKQKELARIIGVTNATMSKYENNINIPNADILCKIAAALNTSADYLVGLTKHIRPYQTGKNAYFSPENLVDIISKLNRENQIRIFERVMTLWEQQAEN